VSYLSKELGIKINLRVANDYARGDRGTERRQNPDGYYGPGSFAPGA